MRRSSSPISVFVIVPVHNRRDLTLRMLASLMAADIPSRVSLRIFVIDDGSFDGTADAVVRHFPDVTVLRGNGDLYWGGAVRWGIDLFRSSDCSHLLLLNDDMILEPTCLTRLFDKAGDPDQWIVSATTLDDSDRIIYGGLIRLPFFRFRGVSEADFIDGQCNTDTVNGNCLLISRIALEAIDLPPYRVYRQEALDMLLGLEATRLGHRPLILRNATCRGNANRTKFWFYRAEAPLWRRFRGLLGPKGVPPTMYWDFCCRFCGVFAPLYFLRPYCRVFFPRHGEEA